MAERKHSRYRGHPFLADKPKGVWCAEAVGIVRGYPKTAELYRQRQESMSVRVTAYNAAGIAGRRGVPDGWSGRRLEAAEARDAACWRAVKVVKKMIEKEIIQLPIGNEARSELAFQFVCRVILDRTECTREKLQASRQLFDFTTAKPASKQEITVNKAEDFLNALLDEEPTTPHTG